MVRCLAESFGRLFVLVKVTVKFIRRGTVWGRREEREKHFLFPMEVMGAKTLSGLFASELYEFLQKVLKFLREVF
jgi:hypothetical protein